jgi:hypothetical protein
VHPIFFLPPTQRTCHRANERTAQIQDELNARFNLEFWVTAAVVAGREKPSPDKSYRNVAFWRQEEIGPHFENTVISSWLRWASRVWQAIFGLEFLHRLLNAWGQYSRHHFSFTNDRIRSISRFPLAPHPRTPSGIVGRNFS